jgi:Domain of unknown function (DUF4124)
MRLALVVLALSAFHAHADLYRWVDRETGSIKYSNTPPPWFGDAERSRNAPPVEVIRERAPQLPPKPAAPPEGAAARASAVAALETRWVELGKALASLPPGDPSRADPATQQRLEAYLALRAELDRLDPAGVQRRRAFENELRAGSGR